MLCESLANQAAAGLWRQLNHRWDRTLFRVRLLLQFTLQAFLRLRASVRQVVGSTDKFSNLCGQATAELVLFVHDFMRADVKQFPTHNVMAAADNNVGIRREIANQVDQVARGGVIWHGDNGGTSLVDTRVLQDVPMRRVAEAGDQAV